MPHIVTYDLKVCNFDAYVQMSFPLLHGVILIYKIIPSYKTWHNFAISGVVKHLETIKRLFYYSVCKIHIFATLLSYLTLLTRGAESESMGIQERPERGSFVSYMSPTVFHCSCKKIFPFLWLLPNACIIAEIQSAFSILWVPSEFKHRSFISSYNGNETSFGRWRNWKSAKCKTRDVELCFLGCFKKYQTKVRLSYMTGEGGEAYIYIKKITKKLLCTLNFIVFKYNYLELCVRFY
jgi:hypothetical protein